MLTCLHEKCFDFIILKVNLIYFQNNTVETYFLCEFGRNKLRNADI